MSRKDDRRLAREKKLCAQLKEHREDLAGFRAIVFRINVCPEQVWKAIATAVNEIKKTEPTFSLTDEQVGIIIDVVAPHLSDRSPQPQECSALARRKYGREAQARLRAHFANNRGDLGELRTILAAVAAPNPLGIVEGVVKGLCQRDPGFQLTDDEVRAIVEALAPPEPQAT